jgi:hypothetical protein
MRKLLACSVLFASLVGGCSNSEIDSLLMHREARDIKKYSETNWRQVSYSVNMSYPATALTDATFAEMKKLGWSKCSGYQEGWDHFVDATQGEGHERTVFQNNSYWFKDGAFVTVSMRYYAGVTKDKHRVDVPDNAQQQVVVLENKNPGVKEKLGITCPQGSTVK